MTFISSSIRRTSIFLFFMFLISFPVAGNNSEALLALDNDAVFCSYFMISSDKPSEQDVEEFCYNIGRPFYTSYKPSEMFSKKSLRNEIARIEKKIKSISPDSVFILKFNLNSIDTDNIEKFFTMNAINESIPRPTPYINGKISDNGPKFIRKTVATIFNGQSSKGHLKGEILISFKPVRAAYEFEKRNIVEQEVTLPVRYVIFQPIKVQILDGKGITNLPVMIN